MDIASFVRASAADVPPFFVKPSAVVRRLWEFRLVLIERSAQPSASSRSMPFCAAQFAA